MKESTKQFIRDMRKSYFDSINYPKEWFLAETLEVVENNIIKAVDGSFAVTEPDGGMGKTEQFIENLGRDPEFRKIFLSFIGGVNAGIGFYLNRLIADLKIGKLDS
jgi:hypothetical protein